MSKQKIVKQLQANIKIIYHRAIDADEKLKLFRTNKQAKFAHVFSKETPFKAHFPIFLPYVEEVALDLQAIQNSEEPHYKEGLSKLLTKMELLFKTLDSFKTNSKDPR